MKGSEAVVAINIVIGVVQIVFGVLFAVFGLFCLLTMNGIDGADIFLVLVFGGGGIWMLIAGIKRQKLIKLFKQYKAIIANSLNGSVANIARTTGAAENIVMKNLQKMIDKKFFNKAYIDLKSGCILFQDQQQRAQGTQNSAPVRQSGQPGIQMMTVTCKGCGGVNRIAKGQVGECEYCGAPVKGE